MKAKPCIVCGAEEPNWPIIDTTTGLGFCTDCFEAARKTNSRHPLRIDLWKGPIYSDDIVLWLISVADARGKSLKEQKRSSEN